MENSNITDPRYLSDAPKEPEVFECGLCNELSATDLDTWVTNLGTLKVCSLCLDFNLKEDTHILIELKQCAK